MCFATLPLNQASRCPKEAFNQGRRLYKLLCVKPTRNRDFALNTSIFWVKSR